MKTYLECIPCFLRQALDAARMATDDAETQERIMRAVLEKTSTFSFSRTPPHMGREIHRIVRELSGEPDPYQEIKRQFNEIALNLYPELKERVQAAARPFETAVRLAIAGNIIDFGLRSTSDDIQLLDSIEDTMARPFGIDDLAGLEKHVAQAQHILYLGDNAGEIVFDRVLIESLPEGRVTFAVKSAPIINDVTQADAEMAGFPAHITVIDNGSDAPGTILESCSTPFRQCFAQADLIIAKGQGNYETLDGNRRPGLFFLLKAKCPVIARDLGCAVGDIVVKHAQ